MAKTSAASVATEAPRTVIRVELGNTVPHEKIDGELVPVAHGRAAVSYLSIPQGEDRNGNPLYAFPDAHDDGLFPAELADTLDALPDGPRKASVRRMLIDGWLNHPSKIKGLPNHEAAVAVIHPGGFWAEVAAAGRKPSWVWSDHKGLEAFLAEYFDCPAGRPANVEDTHYTRHGTSTFPPGAAPDPAAGIEMLHTSYGRDAQSLVMGGFGYLGAVGTATAATATTLTGSAETGVTHTLNDCAGQYLVVSANAAGTGSKVYGLIKSNTTGTTPVYTVDQWYNAATPGGAAATTPNATSLYQVVNGGPSAAFMALSTDTTTPALTGTAGTADAPAITTALTGEIATAGGGLIRKIAPIGHTAGTATWTATPVYTANGSDSLPVTVAKSALSSSNVAQALQYITLVSPTATLSASGDQLTLTATYTMT